MTEETELQKKKKENYKIETKRNYQV